MRSSPTANSLMQHQQPTNIGIQTSATSTLKIQNPSSKMDPPKNSIQRSKPFTPHWRAVLPSFIHLCHSLQRSSGSVFLVALEIHAQVLSKPPILPTSSQWTTELSEEAYELILGVSKSIRSLAAEYDIKG